jgi:L-lysine exporter family protein LysE/ArgO
MGILLGLGAAVPIGPINLEIIRRNLSYGALTGLVFGFGACFADLIYLVLLSYGWLSIFAKPEILTITGSIGALILIYFAYGAFTAKVVHRPHLELHFRPTLHKDFFSGLLLTLSNPITILFWASISSQVVSLTINKTHATLYGGLGVLIGTFSWVIALNTFIYFTQHKISDRVILILNKIGGVLLLGFAAWSIYSAVIFY